MTDLKPGYVRVFQCEACGVLTSQDGATHFARDGRMCHGPITARILADPDVVREECAKAAHEWIRLYIEMHPYGMDDAAKNVMMSVGDHLRALADAPQETESDGGG